MENWDVRLKVLMLKAQKEGIQKEIEALNEVPCMVCVPRGTPGKIVTDDGEGTASVQRHEMCHACNGTGKASGEGSRIW